VHTLYECNMFFGRKIKKLMFLTEKHYWKSKSGSMAEKKTNLRWSGSRCLEGDRI
jgi:hypothetical protein